LKTDVLVIGGSAAGLVAGTAAKYFHPDKSVMVVRKEEKVMIPCGIPYIYGTVGTSDKNILPDAGLIGLGVTIRVDTVTDLDTKEKTVSTESGEQITYDKLILATGSQPSIPKWLKGTHLKNVFTIPKDKVYLDKLQQDLKGMKKIVIVGAGFIGVEVADELRKAGYEVTLVEKLPAILSLAFDRELADAAAEQLTAGGVVIRAGTGIQEILGKDKVTGALLDDGETLDADAVILSLGYLPNTELAQKAGMELNKFGFIRPTCTRGPPSPMSSPWATARKNGTFSPAS
jgi:NADPH-dependent 2,4-dienoyl-CoA reductase/sulfur reductase-like enzyme